MVDDGPPMPMTPPHTVGNPSPDHSPPDTYWNQVGAKWQERGPHPLWRVHTDRLQLALLQQELGMHRLQRGEVGLALLKTDLFDEIAGDGIVRHLIPLGCRVTAVDVASSIVEEARKRNPDLRAVHADIRALPFADGSFDLVYSGSTLDHFDTAEEIDRAIREIQRVLRPDGRLILTLDNPGNPIVWLRNGPLLDWLRSTGIVPYQVGVTLDRRRLTDRVRQGGFSVEAVSGILHCPRALAVWISRIVVRGTPGIQDRFLRHLMSWECLERWPTRFLTGYFTVIHATKRG